jgi:uncharacterized membrane protein
MENNKYSKVAALSTVIANMIGVGVFSSLGFQVVPLKMAESQMDFPFF